MPRLQPEILPSFPLFPFSALQGPLPSTILLTAAPLYSALTMKSWAKRNDQWEVKQRNGNYAKKLVLGAGHGVGAPATWHLFVVSSINDKRSRCQRTGNRVAFNTNYVCFYGSEVAPWPNRSTPTPPTTFRAIIALLCKIINCSPIRFNLRDPVINLRDRFGSVLGQLAQILRRLDVDMDIDMDMDKDLDVEVSFSNWSR